MERFGEDEFIYLAQESCFLDEFQAWSCGKDGVFALLLGSEGNVEVQGIIGNGQCSPCQCVVIGNPR